jgi:GNAT superfamily N-acetyltransferase
LKFLRRHHRTLCIPSLAGITINLGLRLKFERHPMPHIRFTMQVVCENEEPSRVIPAFHGEVFEYREEEDEEVEVGRIDGYLVMRGRALNEGENLFDAMDSISSSTLECCEALFDHESGGWKKSVEDMYENDIPGLDVIFIDTIELEPVSRGKGIGAQVVRETIATLGSSCGLVACKPFALQYVNWMDEKNKAVREQPGFETRRLADFRKVDQFWTDLGFRKLPDSDFYTFAPQLVQQPMPGPRMRSRQIQ